MTTLNISGLKKSFGTTDVLKDINIAVGDRGFLVLLGPSGCGKSTLLNVIAGLEQVSGGGITMDGQEITRVESKDRDIAMVFQSYALYPSMTVERNITFSLEVRGVPREQRRQAAAEVAESLQIAHLLGRKPSQLSGGQRQRVAIGRALVRSPKVFLFDEPLSNLDTQLRLETRALIKRLHQRLGSTSVYVTHDQSEAMTLATHIAVMSKGEVAQFGTPAEIYSKPANLFVARFVGTPPMNFFPASVTERQGQLLVHLENCGAIPPMDLSSHGALLHSVGRKLTIGVRPDQLVLAESAEDGDPVLEAIVDIVEDTGTDMFVYLRSGNQEFILRQPPGLPPKSGATLRVALPVTNMHFFDTELGDRLSD
ncbi:ABC transporter related protein [Devosia sp. LC5]|uniref:ABC transporter ATP-binding protein n=1 Tax=Devosia sp. LC5 TaxID=1502724 RepID=UPI0004E2E3F8|nr:ATP-binding cassette domain-containing protein [Devosia sp. LC5]KFC68196.1 ABC transporter related protein [Devosia sp. LC5]